MRKVIALIALLGLAAGAVSGCGGGYGDSCACNFSWCYECAPGLECTHWGEPSGRSCSSVFPRNSCNYRCGAPPSRDGGS